MSNSSTLSWLQEIIKRDQNWQKTRTQQEVYEFSNGRKFKDKPDPYSTP